MYQITIKKQNVITNQATFHTQEEANSWLQYQISINSFGKNERWIKEGQEDVSQALDVREVEVMGQTYTEYKLAAEYSIEQTDITAQVAQEAINQAALAYLNSTDWMVVRLAETNVPVPQEILEARAAARASIVR